MPRGIAWRSVTVVAALVAALLFLAPNLTTHLPQWWGSVFPRNGITLGLDLQGGIHLVLEVQDEKAVSNSVDIMIEQLKRETREKEIATRDWKRLGDDQIRFELISRSRRDQLDDLIASDYPVLKLVSTGADRTLEYQLIPAEVARIKQFAVEQALETIRNRVDEFGVSEPTIQRTGERGILVQLPGVQDPERAKRLIGRTAQLRFQLVADNANAPGVEHVHGVEGGTYALEPTVLMTGEVIADARHRPGSYGEAPFVSLTLNSTGARLFEQITRNNVGRQLAIVLDGKVQSAPVIRERIGGGRAVITGNFTLDQARDLAIVLRAGALPAPVTIAEERTVGPSLGRDSIRSGTKSFIIGGLLVILFMVIYYRMAGLIADVALVINITMLLGVLAGFEATLTLPGIAGIVLTLGMAVDANVLINERIREELRAGQDNRSALDAGYSRALPAILDSNATTFLAGLILFQFGSGPIKGFALTLCIGIASTIFSAVFASRVLHDFSLVRGSSKPLSV